MLQRVEDFPGLIILASNFKNNLDPAFLRRFNALIYFPMPNANEHYDIWQKTLPEKIICYKNIDFRKLSDKYEISGSSILNIVHYASLKAVANQSYVITEKDITDGIRNEFMKEEKIM